MGKIFTAVISLSILVTVALIGMYFGFIPSPFDPSLSDIQRDCVVAAMHADAREANDDYVPVRREVALSVLRHARHFHRDVCDVFENARTLVPDGYQHSALFLGRKVDFIRRAEATTASWRKDLEMVKDIQREQSRDKGCSTHYIRRHRLTDLITQPEDARQTIKATMRSVGHAQAEGQDVGAAEFFCPN